ncbi:MAG: hypothetical protein K2K28_00620 [Clostridia bacterium]|nr:hypothetical protein [Clostridia bacterium]
MVNSIFTEKQIQEIIEILNRLLNVRLNAEPNKWFGVSDLLGGLNRDWHDMPCQIIYDKYLEIYEEEYGDYEIAHSKAFSRAAQDVGYFYYRIIEDKNDVFLTDYGYSKGKRVRKYKKI